MNSLRLNKIYDYIDAGRYTEAVDLCKSLLTSSKSDLVRSLLAFCYSRSGQLKEARELAVELVAAAPTSSDILAALNLTLSDLKEYSILADLYRQHWTRNGSNLDSNAKLSLANYTKAQDYKSIQSVSIRLSKVAKPPLNNMYAWWSVAALLMQAIAAENSQEKLIALTLASRLVDGLTCDNAQQTYLLTRLYMLSDKLDTAAHLLSQHQDHIRTSLALEEIHWDVLKQLNDHSTIKNKARELLLDGSQNYAHHSAYLSTVGQEDAQEAVALFEDLAEKNTKERGHVMALMELSKQFNDATLPTLIERYWHQFKNKPVCFDDLEVFVKHLYHTNQDTSALLHLFTAALHDEHEAQDTRINAAKLMRSLSITTTIERDLSDAQYFAQQWKEYQYTGNDVPSTDIHPADDWSVLASLCYISAFSKSRDTSHLETASSFMESAMLTNGRSYKLKILMIAVYRILGSSKIFGIVRMMRIQSVQQDTLSHFGCSEVSALSITSGDVAGVLPNTTTFRSVWAQSERECSEMLARLFENGTWSHLEDFTDFAMKLKLSLHKWILWFEHVRVTVSESSKIEEEDLRAWYEKLEEIGDVDSLVDSRDWSLLPNWSPFAESGAREQLHALTYQQKKWLRAYKRIYERVLSLALNKTEKQSSDKEHEHNHNHNHANGEGSSDIEEHKLTDAERILHDISLIAPSYHKQGSDVEKAPVAQQVLEKYGDFAALLAQAKLPVEQLHCVKVAIETWSLIQLAVPAPSKKKKTKSPSYPLYQGVIEALKTMVASWEKQASADASLFARMHELVQRRIDYKNV
ncbi:hypothetical protein E3P99_02301 [Wallemia hederae]|uniref:Uncharacterized protein n=1 Tax=Wallemia hederae TaxID=1540922 RepID=A0A4T0FKW6_9BASI|nr:hypothetical protein E3P99_02301 [Wallemia hederae]